MACCIPLPNGLGALRWYASLVAAPLTIVHSSSQFSAVGVFTRTIVAAASPRFKPLRSKSNGRHGWDDSDMKDWKPATKKSDMLSAPHTTTLSYTPASSIRIAIIWAETPEMHALLTTSGVVQKPRYSAILRAASPGVL